MKNKLHLLIVTLGLATLSVAAPPLVPGIISHQGKVMVNGTNYTGSGQFKFALVDSAGTTTYWSHDGSSTGGAAPASAVTLAVARGIFSVNLGDTTVANMTQVIPASVFANSAVYLRTWFNDGVDGSQQLSPDVRIVSVGYALKAGSAATYSETDPVFSASPASGITAGNITSWNGKVASVSASSPLSSTGGATPALSIQTASGSQSGALSSTDWNTFNGKLGGSGTANYLPFFTAGSTLANSIIYQNSVGGDIGIRTTSPGYDLDVNGWIRANTLITSGNVGINNNTPANALSVVGSVQIQDGTQGSGRVLSSDSNGKASWVNNTAVTPAVMANLTTDHVTIGVANIWTGSSITLPPGKWSVQIAMLIPKVNDASASLWVRSGFSLSNSSWDGSKIADVVGSAFLASGYKAANTYGMVNGTIILNNTSGGNRTYYYWAGSPEIIAGTYNMYDFGTANWLENQIVAYPMN